MRLIDLHVDWPLQYTHESTAFDLRLYDIPQARISQSDGYLQATRAAVIACFRRAEDWAQQADPWHALIELVARIEAEFAGRILIAGEDFDRWEDDKGGLTWALIGIEGFDFLIRSAADLNHLPNLFERGVRVFQPTYSAYSLLAGSSEPGDDRGLLALGYAFLERLHVSISDSHGPKALLDLAHLNPQSCSEVLGWFEADSTRARKLIPVYSHGCPVHEGFEQGRALSLENLRRLRTLGGFIGLGVSPPFFESPDQIQRAVELVAGIPFEGRVGVEGIAVGTDFLGVSRTLPTLANASEVVDWFNHRFDRPTAQAILHDNAAELVARLCGVRTA